MKVLKFGGSSVGSVQNIVSIKNILQSQSENFIVVVSALKGITDILSHIGKKAIINQYQGDIDLIKEKYLALIHEIIKPLYQPDAFIVLQENINQLDVICQSINTIQECSNKIEARLLSFGERISSQILHIYLKQEGIEIDYLNSLNCIVANSNYLKAEVDFKQTEANIQAAINPNKNFIAPGFVAQNHAKEIVVLGRGGSDYTAAIYGSAINASSVELWSDVDGMLNANPQHVSAAKRIDVLSYKEAFELAYFGAKVLYPPAVRPLMYKNIPLHLRSTVEPDAPGTIIGQDSSPESGPIKGVSSIGNISLLSISGVGMAQTKGMARRVFEALEKADVNIILITQACSEQSICLGIDTGDVPKAQTSLEAAFQYDLENFLINPIEIKNDNAIIAVVGDNMHHQVGLSGKIFSTLGANNVNVVAIAQGASERNISVVVPAEDEHKGLNVIHESFFAEAVKKVHVFIAGVGNVGREFLNILENQIPVLRTESKLNVKVVGVANSSKMLFNEKGVSFSDIRQLAEKGTPIASNAEFQQKAIAANLRNSVFIDNTASEVISSSYLNYLLNSISVIGCNKIAGSSEYGNYELLKKTAKAKNCNLMYETTVGAALPIIKTIKELIDSGDKVERIEAVLSGSLNFIFNNYKGEESFSSIVNEALVQGYTEPNPLIDLSGLDVMRKILILAREAGFKKELSDVQFKGFLPNGYEKTQNNQELFVFLEEQEAHFSQLYKQATEKGNKLKVVAIFDKGDFTVGLQEVEPSSPFFHLEGKDNVVALNTKRYPEQPLIIKGAGAGAAVTASGVFSDLMSIIHK